MGLNRRLTEASDEPFQPPNNLHNRSSVEWVLEAIRHPIFGAQVYPTLEQKAAGLAWTIIKSHAFRTACKRTGMAACIKCLRLNDRDLHADDEAIADVAHRVAVTEEDEFSFTEFAEWVEEHSGPFTRPEPDIVSAGSAIQAPCAISVRYWGTLQNGWPRPGTMDR